MWPGAPRAAPPVAVVLPFLSALFAVGKVKRGSACCTAWPGIVGCSPSSRRCGGTGRRGRRLRPESALKDGWPAGAEEP